MYGTVEDGHVELNVTNDVLGFQSGIPNYGWLVAASDELVKGSAKR
jgi:hypothetical protein